MTWETKSERKILNASVTIIICYDSWMRMFLKIKKTLKKSLFSLPKELFFSLSHNRTASRHIRLAKPIYTYAKPSNMNYNIFLMIDALLRRLSLQWFQSTNHRWLSRHIDCEASMSKYTMVIVHYTTNLYLAATQLLADWPNNPTDLALRSIRSAVISCVRDARAVRSVCYRSFALLWWSISNERWQWDPVRRMCVSHKKSTSSLAVADRIWLTDVNF